MTAIVGPVGSSAVKNSHPLCAGVHIPHLTPGATDSRLSFTSADYKYLIKVRASQSLSKSTFLCTWPGYAIFSLFVRPTDERT